MRPVEVTTTADKNAVGISLAQQTAGAGDLLLNGALVDDGVATMLNNPSRLEITSAGNLSGVDFTITGTNFDGKEIVETIAGPNATTVITNSYFYTVSQISVDGAVGTDVTVGPTDQSVSKIVPVSRFPGDILLGIQTNISTSATIDYTLQFTLDNVQTSSANQKWLDVSSYSGKTADFYGSLTTPIRALRIKINSHSSGTVTTTIIQSSGA